LSLFSALSLGLMSFMRGGSFQFHFLSLTVSVPGDYSLYDFQNVVVAADMVVRYTFWVVPEVVGIYVVEVGWFLYS
jgi:hypothetical protein